MPEPEPNTNLSDRPKSMRPLLLGSIGSQAITLVLLLLSVPRYGLAIYGSVAGYLLVKNILSHFAILKSCNTILRTDCDVRLSQVVASAILSASLLAVTATVATSLLVYMQYIVPIGIWIWLGPSIFAGGLYDLYTAIHLRKDRLVYITRARWILAFATGGPLLVLSFLAPKAESIVASYFLGYSAAALYLFHWQHSRQAIAFIRSVGPRALAPNLNDATKGVGGSVTETLSSYGIPAVTEAFLGSIAAGTYLIAARIIYMPVILISQASAQTLQGWASRSNKDQAAEYVTRTIGTWAVLMFGIILILHPLISILITAVYGQRFSASVLIVSQMLLQAPVIWVQRNLEALAIAQHATGTVWSIRATALIAGVTAIVAQSNASDVIPIVLQSIAVSGFVLSIGIIILCRILLKNTQTSIEWVWASPVCVAILSLFTAFDYIESGAVTTIIWITSGTFVLAFVSVKKLYGRTASDARG